MSSINNAQQAMSKWHLYREHGIGKFANWLSMKQDNITSDQVVEAMRFKDVRAAAEKHLSYLRFKEQELETLLAQAATLNQEGS